MKIAAHKVYLPLFVIVLLLQLYLPSFKANILFQLAVLVVIVSLDTVVVSKSFLKMIMPLVALLAIGFISTLFNKYHLYNILKDIFHFLKPITGLLLGYIIFSRVNNYRLFIKSIVVAGIISSAIHLFIVFFIVGINSPIEQIREFTKDNFLDLFALFFLIFYKRFFGGRVFRSKLFSNLALALLLISVVLYFSRTMIIIAFLLLLAVYGFIRITPVTARILSVFMVIIAGLFLYLQNAPIQRGAPGVEGFLYKVKNAPEEIFKTHVNRQNHRDLWDHWRGYEAYRAYMLMEENPYSFAVGTGHGSLVNLKFYAPISKGEPKGMRYISELHNGYMYVFYKVGGIGLILYMFFLFRLYGYAYKNRNFANILVAAIGVIYISSTLTITGLYNARDVIIFILGGALYFAKPVFKTNSQE
jgi:O-Antigen ligase